MTTTIVIDAPDDHEPAPTMDARTRRQLLRQVPTSLPYFPGLDGLRAIAVAVVVGYHAGVSWLPGGFLGVEVFFVVSGYLITALLAREATTSGRVRLRRFWSRRARRLLPALYATLAGVVVWTLVADRDGLERLRREVPAALGYVTNWVLISGDESYFDAVGRPSPLRHLWSLAIEEQFYLVWPIIFLVGLALLPRRALLATVIGGALASTLAMAYWYEPFTDPTAVYYGTVTRMTGLLIGAALALAWRPWERAGQLSDRVVGRAGWLGLAGLAVAVLRIGEFDPFLYQGGFLVVSVLAALLIVGATTNTSLVARVLSASPLRWIGQRSYAIYLWHWPVVVFTRPNTDLSLDGFVLFAYRVGITLFLAALSYRLIEAPYRLGRDRWAASRPLFPPRRTRLRRAGAVAPLVVCTVVLVAVPLLARAPSTASAEDLLTTASTVVPTVSTAPSASTTTTAAPKSTKPSVATTTTAPAALPPGADPALATDVLVVGDSVALGAAASVADALGPSTAVDASIGRQAAEGAGIVGHWIERGWTGSALVIHLGSNGPIRPQDLDAMIAAAGERRVVLLTVRVPRPWEGASNEQILAAASRFENAVLVDWRAASEGHTDWFADDGIHTNPTGSKAYALLVVNALRS